jgi:YMGG-like Gly-zipper
MTHYRRWFLLPLITLVSALFSACSGKLEPQDKAELSRDPSLVLQLEPTPSGQSEPLVSVADACLPLPRSARPTTEERAEAHVLVMRGHQMAIVGNASSARYFFRRATQLDGTNASAAYLAARASDASNDSTEAIRDYCRFLSLAPTNSAAPNVRERILTLAKPRVAPSSRLASRAAPARALPSRGTYRGTPRPMRSSAAAAFVSMRRSMRQPGSGKASSGGDSVSAALADSTIVSSSDGEAITRGSAEPDTVRSIASAANGDSVPQAQRGDTISGEVAGQDAPSSHRRGRHTARDVLIGAAAGAAAGAVIGRDAKGAAIGAAAGGLLGVLAASTGGTDQQ